ncbi:hypothetical protein [Pollutibacter soli]|uniref:hypothetical protein n=1 Tax=Pollutibacter soli TaxID=3034157 RepID=UPI003013C8E0
MKKLLFVLMIFGFALPVSAQLTPKTTCPDFVVDILDGTVNGLKTNVNLEEFKLKLPCFSSAEDENTSSKCGGGVFYKDRDLYFYSGRDYIEIREKFKGKLSLPLMGAKRGSLFKYLGNPKLKDATWDAFQTQYGTLVLNYNTAGKVNKIQFSTKSSETLSLCN